MFLQAEASSGPFGSPFELLTDDVAEESPKSRVNPASVFLASSPMAPAMMAEELAGSEEGFNRLLAAAKMVANRNQAAAAEVFGVPAQ